MSTAATSTAATLVIHSAELVSGGAVVSDGWIAVSGDVIAAVGSGDGWRASAGVETEVIDAEGRWLTPGFIDIHCHGGGGAAFDDGAAGIGVALALHRAHGTTRSVVSLVTAPLADLEARLRVVAALTADDPRVLGSHLEGPFLDVGHKGAHPAGLLVAPTPDAIDRLLDAASGTLRQVTIAPEVDGGLAAIAQLTAAGVAVAVGHTSATYDQARAAFDAGASILTHAFNGMPPLLHREPGPVGAAIAAGATLELINDGVHVHPEVARILFAAAPGRIALITDAMEAAGVGDGHYGLGGSTVTVLDGVARLDDGGSIAGSTLTLDAALRRAVTDVGLSVADAVAAVTSVPAAAIGRGGDLGTLAPGNAADAVLLDADLGIHAVWAAGARLA
ncbi:MAG: N-acetylglucosamine-6-phosphate deacetylase [Pseudolysinimonas sp.]